MEKIYKIFYSWQSDLPRESTKKAIRTSLKKSIINLEINKDLNIEIDEATRNLAGSPNIPLAIFNKIQSADIFLCDLSIINSDSNGRKLPNPNVLIELGYAIGVLGWERIIMVFNTLYGKLSSDLPFDIGVHRVTSFKIENLNDKNGIGQLSNVLEKGLSTIIEKNPMKNNDCITPDLEKRKRDVRNLLKLLECIHIPTFKLFLFEYPASIPQSIFYFMESFKEKHYSNLVSFYDEKLNSLIDKFGTLWYESLSFGIHFESKNKSYRFTSPMYPPNKAKEDYLKMEKIGQEISSTFSELSNYIRENYLEIDLEETSKDAKRYRLEFRKETINNR